jgi:cyclopropane fatty-acyl-phospholipid synthase-like methyltransferase
MSPKIESSYDKVPYDSFPYPQSHPDRLATVAALFGLRPAHVDTCRVLELGCAAGGNLIPMALTLPGSRSLGVDFSAVEVNEGKQTIKDLGLENIELRQASILDIDAAYGKFDYILCHGVYSWVADEVQEKILSICKANLAPAGIAGVRHGLQWCGWFWYASIGNYQIP